MNAKTYSGVDLTKVNCLALSSKPDGSRSSWGVVAHVSDGSRLVVGECKSFDDAEFLLLRVSVRVLSSKNTAYKQFTGDDLGAWRRAIRDRLYGLIYLNGVKADVIYKEGFEVLVLQNGSGIETLDFPAGEYYAKAGRVVDLSEDGGHHG